MFRLHTLKNIHPVDANHKIYEHVKCLLKLSNEGIHMNKAQESLYEAIDIVESTNVEFLSNEAISRLLTIKGVLLSKLDK